MRSVRRASDEHIEEATISVPPEPATGMTSLGISTRTTSAASSSGMVRERTRSERKRFTPRILLFHLLGDDSHLAKQLAVDVGAAVEDQAVLELLQLVHPEHH